MTATQKLIAAALAAAFTAPVLAQDNTGPTMGPAANHYRTGPSTTTGPATNNPNTVPKDSKADTSGYTTSPVTSFRSPGITHIAPTATNYPNNAYTNSSVVRIEENATTTTTTNSMSNNQVNNSVGNNYNGRRYLDQATHIKTEAKDMGPCDGPAFRPIWELATMGQRPYNLVAMTPNSVTFRTGQYAESNAMRKYVADRINREMNPDLYPVNVVSGDVSASTSGGNGGSGGNVTGNVTVKPKAKPSVTDTIFMCTPTP